MSSSRSALEVIAPPRQQSGQCTVQEIHKQAERLKESGKMVKMLWVPSGEEGFPMGGRGGKQGLAELHAKTASLSNQRTRPSPPRSDW
jgi:hypothetical protein